MPTRHFHITKHDKGWQLKEQDADRVRFTVPTKAEAVKKAAAWASKTATVKEAISIKIHGVDGRVKEQRTFLSKVAKNKIGLSKQRQVKKQPEKKQLTRVPFAGISSEGADQLAPVLLLLKRYDEGRG